MNAKELAGVLSGREYENEITRSMCLQAKEAGLVVVFGFSDYLMEFRGAFRDEMTANHGDDVFIDSEGVLPEWEEIESADAMRLYQKRKEKAKAIKPMWSHEQGEPSWSYQTEIQHHCFDVFDCGDLFCRGIVFSVSDL